MKLTFVSHDNKEIDLGNFNNVTEAEKEISEFLKQHDYKSYYFKISQFVSKLVYDVGSWNEFFIVYYNDNHELNTTGVWEE